MKQVNVICIKWGDLYSSDYVNKLYAMVERNITRDHRFVCLTDDTSGLKSEIETIPIPDIFLDPNKPISGWRKISMCSPEIGDLKGTTLFLDLDVVVIDNIDCFFDHSDKFTIIENWSQLNRGIGNSSVFCFEIGAHVDVLDYYNENAFDIFKEFGNSQTYMSKRIGDIDYWPEQWCRSFKYQAIPKGLGRFFKTPQLPEGCKILVFHGIPNPDQAIIGDYGPKRRRFFKPTAWIADYWHE